VRKGREKTYFKRRNTNSNKYIKYLANWEMETKTPLSFHPNPVRIAIIDKTNYNKCWRTDRVTQEVEHLPSKYEALSSNPSPIKTF
jgi:hypothetical protein